MVETASLKPFLQNYHGFQKRISWIMSPLVSDFEILSSSKIIGCGMLNSLEINIVSKSRKITWYKGKSILDTIISIKNKKLNTDSFLSVQNIHRPNRQIRNFLGDLHGSIKTNQKIKILPSENTTSIKSIFHNFKKVKKSFGVLELDPPKNAEENTIRKLFGISIDKNSVHGSDSPENAKIELDFFFKD